MNKLREIEPSDYVVMLFVKTLLKLGQKTKDLNLVNGDIYKLTFIDANLSDNNSHEETTLSYSYTPALEWHFTLEVNRHHFYDGDSDSDGSSNITAKSKWNPTKTQLEKFVNTMGEKQTINVCNTFIESIL